jgi:hypothetical protein
MKLSNVVASLADTATASHKKTGSLHRIQHFLSPRHYLAASNSTCATKLQPS